MGLVTDPEKRFWRSEMGRGRGIYALISNDPANPSEHDPLIGVMESMQLAEEVVDLHNKVLEIYGPKHYRKALGMDD